MAQMQFRSDDTEVWPYKFGDGSDGAYNSSSSVTWNPTDVGCAGTAGNYSITADAGSMSNGQLVLIHQSRGTNAGVWELNKIASGGGTTSLTMAHTLKNSYVNSGSSQAQMVRIYEYTDFTLNSGHTITSKAWNGSDGGIIAIAAQGTATIAGTLTAKGKGFLGSSGYSDGASGQNISATIGYYAEGTGGPGNIRGTNNNRNGNGAGASGNGTDGLHCIGGSGGGNGTSGSQGEEFTAGADAGQAGSTAGNSALTAMCFGGGGSGGTSHSGANPLAGANGGGLILLLAKNLVVTGSINAGGNSAQNGTAGDPHEACGGGGAGGSILLKTQTSTLGSSKVLAAAGAGGVKHPDGRVSGGNGGVGRIHLDYMNSYTGSTSPTLNASQDYSLRLGYSSSVII